MTKQRANLGFGAALDDLGGFDPKAKPASPQRVVREDIAEAAEAAGFRSREPKLAASSKVPRRRRTGRSAQFNIKATPETIETFCNIADANGWGLGETLEHAVALLRQQYHQK